MAVFVTAALLLSIVFGDAADADNAPPRKHSYGFIRPSDEVLQKYHTEPFVRDDLPDSFDAREQWPGSVHAILNQGQCGSCWAFSATEVLSDRFAIHSNNTIDVVLSPQDLVSCDVSNFACEGGNPISAWQYFESQGFEMTITLIS